MIVLLVILVLLALAFGVGAVLEGIAWALLIGRRRRRMAGLAEASGGKPLVVSYEPLMSCPTFRSPTR